MLRNIQRGDAVFPKEDDSDNTLAAPRFFQGVSSSKQISCGRPQRRLCLLSFYTHRLLRWYFLVTISREAAVTSTKVGHSQSGRCSGATSSSWIEMNSLELVLLFHQRTDEEILKVMA